MQAMKNTLAILALLLAPVAFAQAPANMPIPNQTSVAFTAGASMLGAGGQNATPAADITLDLNAALAQKNYFKDVRLLSDNANAPAIDWQYYGGGARGPIPVSLPKASALSPLSFYWRGTVGIERIVPATGPSQSHVGAMIGGGAEWTTSPGVVVRLFEAGVIISPRAAWGQKVPYVSGGISYLFGH